MIGGEPKWLVGDSPSPLPVPRGGGCRRYSCLASPAARVFFQHFDAAGQSTLSPYFTRNDTFRPVTQRRNIRHPTYAAPRALTICPLTCTHAPPVSTQASLPIVICSSSFISSIGWPPRATGLIKQPARGKTFILRMLETTITSFSTASASLPGSGKWDKSPCTSTSTQYLDK